MEPKSPDLSESLPPELFAQGDKAKLIIVDDDPPTGNEKTTFRVNLGTQELAAKIIMPEMDTQGSEGIIPVTFEQRKAKAESEFLAYKKLKDTALGAFIPTPRFLLNDANGNVIGLAVDWVEGDQLDNFDSKPLANADVDALETALLSLQGDLRPDADMMEPYNLLFTKGSPSIRIAECEFDTSFWETHSYDDYVKKSMDYLREEYAE